jgi:Uma2 family endonuclease
MWRSSGTLACRHLLPAATRRWRPISRSRFLSPDDRPGEILAKVGDWLSAGSQLVWVVDPVRRLARVFRADGTQSQLAETDALDGEDVLPGFSCPLADVL